MSDYKLYNGCSNNGESFEQFLRNKVNEARKETQNQPVQLDEAGFTVDDKGVVTPAGALDRALPHRAAIASAATYTIALKAGWITKDDIPKSKADQKAFDKKVKKAEKQHQQQIETQKYHDAQAMKTAKFHGDKERARAKKVEDQRKKDISKGKKVDPTPPKPVLGRWNTLGPAKGDIHTLTLDRAKLLDKEVKAWEVKYGKTLSKTNKKAIKTLSKLTKTTSKEIKGLDRWWKSKQDNSVYLNWQSTMQTLGGEFDRIKVSNFKEKGGDMKASKQTAHSKKNESFEQMIRGMVTEAREEIKREN